MSIELELPSAQWFADIVTAVHALVDEAVLEVTPERVHLAAMDPGRVAMIHFDLPKVIFSEYVYTEEAPDVPGELAEKVLLGLNWTHLREVFKGAGDEPVRLTFGNPLTVEFQSHPSRRFQLPSVDDIVLEGPHVHPALDWPCFFRIEPTYLNTLITTLKRFADACQVQVTPEGDMIWTTQENGRPHAEIRIRPNDPPIHQWDTPDTEMESTFTLDYLARITKYLVKVGGDALVSLRLGHDLPFRVDLPLRPMSPPLGGGRIGWYVAPRIKEEG